MTFCTIPNLFFCEFDILQSHSILLQKLHSCSINGLLHTALYFFATYRIRIYPDQIFPKLLLKFKLYSLILTPNEFFLYWIRIHSFLHIRIYSKQMYHHFFHKEQEKTVPISLIFYYLGNLSGKNGLSNKINFFSFQKGDHGMYAGRLINPTLAQV